jgi:LmeA-like phospholipid-binding
MRRLVIVLIVLLVLVVGADRLAWKLAEREVGSQIQSSEGLSKRPDVSIGGFPFLTQVVQGRYSSVSANLEDLTAEQGLTIDHTRVQLTGLQVPLNSLLNQSLDSVPVEAATATGNVSYASLNAAAAARIPGDQLAVRFARGSAGGDQIAFTGQYTGGLVNLQVDGVATVTADDGQLVISIVPESLRLPAPVRGQVARLLGTSYRVPPLPLGLQVSGVSVGADGVAVTATGSDLVLRAAGLG